MFSKACEYGIRASLYVVSRSTENQNVGLKEITKAIDSPTAFTAKVLQQLVRVGILESVKGPNGGFFISQEKAKKTPLSKLVSAIDGDRIYDGCGLGLPTCNADQPCPLHDQFVSVRKSLKQMLEDTTLYDLGVGFTAGDTVLKLH